MLSYMGQLPPRRQALEPGQRFKIRKFCLYHTLARVSKPDGSTGETFSSRLVVWTGVGER